MNSKRHGGMTIFISDLHLGQEHWADDGEAERSVVRLLESMHDRMEHLVLVGDVFDQYIEYRYLIPKGFVRLQAALLKLTESGKRVTYLVGNHDPWHIDYFERELGVQITTVLQEKMYGHNVISAHGDGIAGQEFARSIVTRIVRHPLSTLLYRSLIPADIAYRLAWFVRTRFGPDEVRPETITRVRETALHKLKAADADVVVAGHTHVPEFMTGQDGTYVNCGSWLNDRTFAVVDAAGPRLMCWNGRSASLYADSPDERHEAVV